VGAGRGARRQGLTYRVVYYWQLLISRWPDVRLEEYTRRLDIYRCSPAGSIERMLAMEGTLYSLAPGRVKATDEANAFVVSNAVAYNPLPLVIWEELGDCYSRMGKPQLSLAAYDKALAAAPSAGQWAQRVRERLASKQQKERPKVKAQEPQSAGPAEAQSAAEPAARQDTGPPTEPDGAK